MIDLTLAIATCGRPFAVRRLLKSIEKYVTTPHKTILLDNTYYHDMSWNPNYGSNIDKNIEVNDRLIGCCESNNLLAENCETRYIMHLDDDVHLQSDIITPMYEKIKNSNYSIIGTRWKDDGYGGFRPPIKKYLMGYDYDGNRILYKLTLNDNAHFEWVESDESLHTMIVDKDVYKKVKWDNSYIWKGDRLDFFYNCKKHNIKTLIYLSDFVNHSPVPFKYKSVKEEQDSFDAVEYFTKKWGVTPLVGWNK